jgi:hypothetical protein
MRIAIGCAALAVIALASCGGSPPAAPAVSGKQPEDTGRPASTVQTGDPKTAGQLVSGFYGIENGAWRWTQRQFTVLLASPAGAAQSGAILELRLTVPPPSIEKLKSLTLTASVEGTDLGSQTYTAPGPYIYKKDVPAKLLAGGSVKVAFQLDKSMTPGGADMRDLGVVVSSVALQSR